MVVRVFYSSLSGSVAIKKQQNDIIDLLSAKNVQFEKIDLSEPNNEETKNAIYEGIKKLERPIVPPHIFSGDEYLGGYGEFKEAIEMEELESFLKLPGDKPKSFVCLAKDESSDEVVCMLCMFACKVIVAHLSSLHEISITT
ncbi:SH3 domain binding glutamate rich protein like 2 [Paragonimus heterotremus]|uniref:SH3 domain binding glutamate rich protein like 2 n=1 Tax=Paragonimus heterotremus TaxID=100268 RepID=A0A8J4T437_9TREM|nr:SH3 domain binding glutamate rich protein like 2 [Paragonimus heterotremus]